MRRHHNRGPAWSVNLSDALPVSAPVQTFVLELPIEQRATLVFLRKQKDGPESAAAAVMKRLDADKVSFGKWAELRREGYVTFEAKLGGHRLTPKGHQAAGDVIRDFCFRFSIHVFAVDSRGERSGIWSRCSCGTWNTGPHNRDRFGESRMRTAMSSHVKDVEAGVWPMSRTLTEFLNRVDPLKLDFQKGRETNK